MFWYNEDFYDWKGWEIVKWFISLGVLAFVLLLIFSYYHVLSF